MEQIVRRTEISEEHFQPTFTFREIVRGWCHASATRQLYIFSERICTKTAFTQRRSEKLTSGLWFCFGGFGRIKCCVEITYSTWSEIKKNMWSSFNLHQFTHGPLFWKQLRRLWNQYVCPYPISLQQLLKHHYNNSSNKKNE